MKRSVLLILFVGIFVLGFVSANGDVSTGAVSSSEHLFFRGDVQFNLKSNYSAGDELNTVFTVSNSESFPIVGSALDVEIVRGCSNPSYPSQISDCDNVFYSKVIKDINLVPNSEKKIKFSYQLPNDLASGTYRLDVYYRTERTPIVGMAQIFLPGRYKSFRVEGSGEFPYARIIRTKTEINNETGPIGVGVNQGDSAVLKLYVFSIKSRKVLIKTTTCSWQDSLCSKPLSVLKNPLSLIKGEVVLPINLVVPQKRGVYAIRLEILDGDRLVSLYRSRLIIMGKAARVRKLYTDKYYYPANSTAILTTLVGGSPDHWSNPIVKNVELETKISDLIGGENYSRKVWIGELSPKNFYVAKNLTFNIKNKLSDFKVCAKLFSGEIIYDNYCYVVNSSLFETNKHKIILNKNFKGSNFAGIITVENFYTGTPIVADLFVLVKEEGKYLFSNSKNSVSSFPISFDMKRGKDYTITIQDKTTSQTKVFNIKRGLSSSWAIFLLGLIVIVAIVVLIVAIGILLKRRRMYGKEVSV